jgi:hypothetical protein
MTRSARQRVRTNLSLRSIRHIGASRNKNGLPVNGVSKVLKHTQLVQQAAASNERRQARLQGIFINLILYI